MDNTTATRLDAVANALQIQNFVEKIDEENLKRSREEIKETKELVSALRDLNKKIGSVGKESSGEKNIFSSWIGEKIEPIKKLTSLQGITEVLAAKAGPGLTGAILGTAAEGMQARRDEKQRKASFVSSVLEGTDVGRTWQKEHGVEKASRLATEIYKEREILEKKIAVLDKKEKLIRGDGSVEGAGLDKQDTEYREELKRKLQENKDFFKEKSPKSPKSPKVIEDESFEKLRDEMIEGVRSAQALGTGLDKQDTEYREELKRKLQENKDFFKEKSPKVIEDESFEKLRYEMIEGVRAGLALDKQDTEYREELEQKENKDFFKEKSPKVIEDESFEKLRYEMIEGVRSGLGLALGASLDQQDTEYREELEQKLRILQENKDFFKEKSPKVIEDESFEKLRYEMIEGVRAGLELDQQTQEHDDILEVRSETIGAALNELSKISESQLQELVRIADNFDKRELSDKENLLERVKEKQNSLETLEKNESEKSNPLRNLLDKGLSILDKGKKAIPSLLGRGASALGGVTKTVGTTIARTAPTVLRSLSPAGAVAAAGAGGYMVGKHAVNPALNAIAEKITGVEDETVGTAIYTGVDKLAGSKLGNMLGFKSDAQKMEEAESKALVEIGKKRLAEGKTVTTNMANAMIKSGIEVSTEQISDKKPEANPNNIQSEIIESKQSENELPKKQETRVQITDAVERVIDQVDHSEKTKNTSVVNAPTVVNNSTSNTTITHKPLRNTEPSYVTGMNRKLVF